MSDIAISVEGLSKSYLVGHESVRRGGYQTLRETLTHNIRSFGRKAADMARGRQIIQGDEIEEFWALKDVSFEVRRGEVLGIIGRNGAGKSTLLKVLSRITEPSRGRVKIKGRVASLLEVGTGFHPELTGRENIYLNGAILGMTRVEIKRKFDEIVDFSGVEKFLDTPVKRYSSGMYVRLAFAVAAHMEPEILIVDEVLAVGDAEFQKKCLGKMQDVAIGMGRTVLLVSHNMIAVQSLCQRAVLLERGNMINAGPVASVIASYMSQNMNANQASVWDDPATAPGNNILRLRRIAISDGSDLGCTLLTMQSNIRIETEYAVSATDDRMHITYHLLNDQGIIVLTSGNKPRVHSAGTYRVVLRIPGNLLNSGAYFLKLVIVRNDNTPIYERENVASFDVKDTAQRDTAHMGREPGIVQPILEWHTDGPIDGKFGSSASTHSTTAVALRYDSKRPELRDA